jgi:hypothetical protein
MIKRININYPIDNPLSKCKSKKLKLISLGKIQKRNNETNNRIACYTIYVYIYIYIYIY